MSSPVTVENNPPIRWIRLTRPDQRNALEPTMIQQLTEAFQEAGADDNVRAVVLAGDGPAFCAGADLEWMRQAAEYDEQANFEDAQVLAELLHAIADCPKPVVARVHGAVVGGGVGLVAAADVAIAEDDTWFQLSEVKLGLIPAVILPYVIEAIGPRRTRQLTVTADKLDAKTAKSYGLITECVPPKQLNAQVTDTLTAICAGGPDAIAQAKQFIREVAAEPLTEKLRTTTAKRIAAVRAMDEARAGIAAFFARQKPPWAS